MSKHSHETHSQNNSPMASEINKRVSDENSLPKHAFDPSKDDNLTVSKIKNRLFEEKLQNEYTTTLDSVNSEFRDADRPYTMEEQFKAENAEFDKVFDEYHIPTTSSEASATESGTTSDEESDKNDLIELWRQDIFEKYGNDPEMREQALNEGPSNWLRQNGHDAFADEEDALARERSDSQAKNVDSQKDDSGKTIDRMNNYGLTAEEFTALKALKSQYQHLLEPVNPVDTNEHAPSTEKIEKALDMLEDAVDTSFEHDQAENAVNNLEAAVEHDTDADADEPDDDDEHSPAPTAKLERVERGRFRDKLSAIRNKANAARARKAIRESFKSKFNEAETDSQDARLKPVSFFGRLISRFKRKKQK